VITTKDLRAAYEKWCFETGEQAWKAPAMAAQLQERGCTQHRTNAARLWRGIALAGDAAEELSTRLHFEDWAERASGEYKDRESASRPVTSVDNSRNGDAVTDVTAVGHSPAYAHAQTTVYGERVTSVTASPDHSEPHDPDMELF